MTALPTHYLDFNGVPIPLEALTLFDRLVNGRREPAPAPAANAEKPLPAVVYNFAAPWSLPPPVPPTTNAAQIALTIGTNTLQLPGIGGVVMPVKHSFAPPGGASRR